MTAVPPLARDSDRRPRRALRAAAIASGRRVARAARWWLAFALLACSAAIPPLPSRGGPEWVELTSAHFTLWTNASATRGHAIVREMERRRDVVMRAMNHATSSSSAFVIALRNTREVEVYTGRGFVGFAWSEDNPTGVPGILMSADPQDLGIVVTHELTHVVSFGIIRHQPRWLAEGIATYFESADLDASSRFIELGRPSVARANVLRRSRLRATADLLFGCDGPCIDGVYYATSWALFSYLLNEHYDRLGQYLRRLDEMQHDRHAEVWTEVFPDLPPEKLDIELASWLRIGEMRLPRIQVAVRDVPVTQRALGDADVLAARGLLGVTSKRDVAAIRADTDAALALDRTNLLARLIDAQLTDSIAPEVAREVAAAHPGDWRAWRLVARALHGTREGDAALAHLCALSARSAAECVRATTAQ
jgi:hypothetical protein